MTEQPSDKPESSPSAERQKTDKSANAWMGDMVSRSTGLPRHEKPAIKDDAEGSGLWKFAGIGLQFAGTLGLMAYVGYLVDKKMGWNGAAVITLSIVGVIGGMYLLIKESMKQDK